MGGEIESKLKKLKADYIIQYMSAHSKVRLGIKEEGRKNKLLSDKRLQTLINLAKIEIMPNKQVAEYKARLDSFVSCFKLTQSDLEKNPVCPHCGYTPIKDGIAGTGAALIDDAEKRLDNMTEEWTNILLTNLQVDWVQQNIELLKSDEKITLRSFINSKVLPPPNETLFFIALKTALSSLERVSITVEDIHKVLQRSGGPVSPGEIRQYFDDFIESLTRGKDTAKVRIVVE
jgi:hypothetical protein